MDRTRKRGAGGDPLYDVGPIQFEMTPLPGAEPRLIPPSILGLLVDKEIPTPGGSTPATTGPLPAWVPTLPPVGGRPAVTTGSTPVQPPASAPTTSETPAIRIPPMTRLSPAVPPSVVPGAPTPAPAATTVMAVTPAPTTVLPAIAPPPAFPAPTAAAFPPPPSGWSPTPPPPPPPPAAGVTDEASFDPTITDRHDVISAGPTWSPDQQAQPADAPVRAPMLPFRVLAAGGVSVGLALSGWQIARVLDGRPRSGTLAWGSLLAGVLGVLGVLLWTWIVVENARRVLSPARTQELPRPIAAVATWIVPLVSLVAAAGVVAYLSRRLNSPLEGTQSALPLVVALAAILLSFPLMYRPVTYLTAIVRRLGGPGIRLGEWLLVPLALTVVGGLMIAGLRLGRAFGDDVEGIAPAWVVGVAAIVPIVVTVLLGWRAAGGVEKTVITAFHRRLGTKPKVRHRSRLSSFFFAEHGPNHALLRMRGHVQQVPGGSIVAMIATAGLAGLALLSVIGALVMYLFWRESNDGIILASQTDRAWEVVAILQTAERALALGLMIVASVWSSITVLNVRMASARRRNPVIAAATWPVAAAGIWAVGDRFVADGGVADVVFGLALQSVLLYLPFAVLERSADAIGARRNSFRVAFAMGVVMLVNIEGLAGLSTLPTDADVVDFGRLTAYLAMGALVQITAMFVVTDAMGELGATTRRVAEKHNHMIDELAMMDARPLPSSHVTNMLR